MGPSDISQKISLQLTLNGNELLIVINGLDKLVGISYSLVSLRVFYNQRNHATPVNVGEYEYLYKLQNPGLYYAELIIKVGGTNCRINSFPVYYSVDSEVREKESISRVSLNNLDFVQSNYPYEDFVITNILSDNIQLFDSFKRKKYDLLSNTITLFTNGNTEQIRQNFEYVFSGTGVINQRLVWGSKDLNEKISAMDLVGKIGNYSAIIITSDSITISTDYFGMGKIFYYCREGVWAVSNRLHLLLILLSRCNVRLSLNKTYAESRLYVQDYLTISAFSRETIVNDVFILRPDEILEIAGIFKVSKSEMGTDLNNLTEISSQSEYEVLLKQSKNEIVNNLKIALDSNHFDKYIIDVTGGIDSRLAFAALTCIPESEGKDITVNTWGAETELICSTAISDYYHYNYSPEFTCLRAINADNLDTVATTSIDLCLSMELSYKYGVYSGPSGFTKKSLLNFDKCLNIGGTCGELLRPYFINNYFLGEPVYDSGRSTVERYVKNLSNFARCDSKYGLKLVNMLYDSIQSIGVDSGLLSFELLNAFSSSRSHFDLSFDTNYRTPYWSVLTSKTAFKGNLSTISLFYPKYGTKKFMFDLLHEMNPDLERFRYSDDTYNEEWKKYSTFIINNGEAEISQFGSDHVSNRYKVSKELMKTIKFPSLGVYRDEWSKKDRFLEIRLRTKSMLIYLNELFSEDTTIYKELINYVDNCDYSLTRYLRDSIDLFIKISEIYYAVLLMKSSDGINCISFNPAVINTSELELNTEILSKMSSDLLGQYARTYRDGIGVAKNIDKSCILFEYACDASPIWINEYCDLLLKTGNPNNYIKMVNYLLKNKNDPESIGRLARAYRDGTGVQVDLQKAVELMRKAAESTYPVWAKWELYDMLKDINTTYSFEEMIKLATKYSSMGNSELQFRLARAYRDGTGVQVDLQKALDLMSKAAQQPNPVLAKVELNDLLEMVNTNNHN